MFKMFSVQNMSLLNQLLLLCSVFPAVGLRQYQWCPLPSMPNLQRTSQGTTCTNRNSRNRKLNKKAETRTHLLKILLSQAGSIIKIIWQESFSHITIDYGNFKSAKIHKLLHVLLKDTNIIASQSLTGPNSSFIIGGQTSPEAKC